MARLERLKGIRVAQQKEKEAAFELARQQEAAAAPKAAPAAVATEAEPVPIDGSSPESTQAANSSEKVLKKRKSAGKSKKHATATGCGSMEAMAAAWADTDRRGKLSMMRQVFKWTDGCGVQYVQREAALGTASMYGDIEASVTDDEFGVSCRHIVFEAHCFKYIHDAAGKVACHCPSSLHTYAVTCTNTLVSHAHTYTRTRPAQPMPMPWHMHTC